MNTWTTSNAKREVRAGAGVSPIPMRAGSKSTSHWSYFVGSSEFVLR